MDRPVSHRIVILGGGYGGLNVALQLEGRLSRLRATDREILLVDRHGYHQHVILLHEVAANSITPRDATVPFSRLLRGKRIGFVRGEVAGVDLERRSAVVDGREIPYQHLVLALGSETDFFGIPGLRENSFTLKSVEDAVVIRDRVRRAFTLVRDASPEERRALLTFVVGGGGFTGVEMAGELADWLPELAEEHQIPRSEIRLALLEATDTILAGFGRRPTRIAREKLAAKGVELKTGAPVVTAEPGLVYLGSGETVPTRTLIWVGGVEAPPQLAQWGMRVGPRGRAVVNEFLQAADRPEVYVLGDSSLVIRPATGRPVPPSAQVALQQAECVADNVAADLGIGRHRRYELEPMGDVISLGRRDAVATFGPVLFDGYRARLLKESIALRYYHRIGGLALALEKLPSAWRATGFDPRLLLSGA